MKIRLKRFDKNLPLPSYKSPGAAAMDVYARETMTIAPHTVGLVPLNMAVEVPPGYWVLLAARSSLFKKGVMLSNGIGIGDEDFSGDNDEYRAALLNFTDHEVTIERGDRIAQMMVLPIEKIDLIEVEQLGNQDRGWIGSTGSR